MKNSAIRKQTYKQSERVQICYIISFLKENKSPFTCLSYMTSKMFYHTIFFMRIIYNVSKVKFQRDKVICLSILYYFDINPFNAHLEKTFIEYEVQ